MDSHCYYVEENNAKPVYTGLELTSPTSRYIKLVIPRSSPATIENDRTETSDYGAPYDAWKLWCSGEGLHYYQKLTIWLKVSPQASSLQ